MARMVPAKTKSVLANTKGMRMTSWISALNTPHAMYRSLSNTIAAATARMMQRMYLIACPIPSLCASSQRLINCVIALSLFLGFR